VEQLSPENVAAVLVFLRGGLPVIFEVVAHGGVNEELVMRAVVVDHNFPS
jgi:hypothetical protein